MAFSVLPGAPSVTAPAGVSQEEFNQQAAWVAALAETDPMLKKALEAYKAENTSLFESYVLQSDFYKNNNSTARQRKVAQSQQPGVAQNDLNNYLLTTKKRLISSGVAWNSDVEKIVTNGYWMGMTDTQLDDSIATSKKIAMTGGGTAGDAINSLKLSANSYGVADLLGNDFWSAKQQSLFSGTSTTTDIENEIKNLAASTYPAYAEGIKNGVAMNAQASNVIQTVARYLELDPNSLTFNDPRVRKIMQYTDPTTKQPAIMPQWLVEKTVKSDPAWAYTNNARDTIDSLQLQVFKDWGLA